MATRVYHLKIYRAKNGQWSWRLRGKNGRTIAVAGETFKSSRSAKHSVMKVIDGLLAVSKEWVK